MGEKLCQLLIWWGTNIKNLQGTQKTQSPKESTPHWKKWVHELNREFSKEEVKMHSKYMKKWSTSLVIKEM
jgi:hypothetical protein